MYSYFIFRDLRPHMKKLELPISKMQIYLFDNFPVVVHDLGAREPTSLDVGGIARTSPPLNL